MESDLVLHVFAYQKTEVSANGLHSALAQALQRLAGAATFMDRAGLLEDERIPGLIILWTLGFWTTHKDGLV